MLFKRRNIMRTHFTTAAKVLTACLVALALFAGGYVAGQNKFGQPKTIIHMVILKWNPGVSDSDKQAALEGVKEMAAKIPGVKNIWIKAERLQPRDFSAAFAIEFQNRAAADAYAESPIHQAWEQKYTLLREQSVSEQVTNP
jgi:antibiotic biosynthesis monooxygenase (ABM) superfamily enzyme